MAAYYNEIDPYAAQWLRNLIAAGHIAPGDVDERSIEDVRPDGLRGYDQCHFFAGIGVWSHALRRAGWPDDRPVWTGSCPCQPFSAAGKGAGFDDERHLWPAWHWLISKCRPDTIFGEQVSGKDGWTWLDLVSTDLEGIRYACGALPFPAAGIGAPHIRERIYFVAHPHNARPQGRSRMPQRAAQLIARTRGMAGSLAHDDGIGLPSRSERLASLGYGQAIEPNCSVGALADPSVVGRREECAHTGGSATRNCSQGFTPGLVAGSSPVGGYWSSCDWILCRDPDGARWRPVEPGAFPLAHEPASRVGRLRAYGNPLVAEAATQFILAARDILTY
ncbi:DNA cytosine methyltransferase [Burkholderia pseudomallei]|uniref:DNA cytosine methyltransferase n=1 Tax=Burkholderia pseudomallei TaxID=28450 RepID=UPI0009B2946D|nr:DNA cytosine methyltransferase [Burkholderia pseudomallei]